MALNGKYKKRQTNLPTSKIDDYKVKHIMLHKGHKGDKCNILDETSSYF